MPATGSSTRQRRLSREFVTALMPGGFMNSLLEVVKADDTLSLNIRCDTVNIYYRGGNLLEVRRGRGGLYRLKFDPNYCNVNRSGLGALPAADPGSLPSVVQEGDREAIGAWLRQFPLLKSTMDIWQGLKGHKYEREFQQLIERSNNGNYATDYFICDIEYVRPGGDKQRLDMVGIHWPVGDRGAKGKPPKLAFIEVKFREAAIGGTSGVKDHILKLQGAISNNGTYLKDLADEMCDVFNQRMELGLIECHKNGKPRKIGGISREGYQYLILLADHYPASTELDRALNELLALPPNPPDPPLDIRIATANLMGYGLFDEGVFDLAEFVSNHGARIHSGRSRRPCAK